MSRKYPATLDRLYSPLTLPCSNNENYEVHPQNQRAQSSVKSSAKIFLLGRSKKRSNHEDLLQYKEEREVIKSKNSVPNLVRQCWKRRRKKRDKRRTIWGSYGHLECRFRVAIVWSRRFVRSARLRLHDSQNQELRLLSYEPRNGDSYPDLFTDKYGEKKVKEVNKAKLQRGAVMDSAAGPCNLCFDSFCDVIRTALTNGHGWNPMTRYHTFKNGSNSGYWGSTTLQNMA